MVASRFFSSGMEPRLHLKASSILSVVLFLFAFFAISTIASAQPAYVQQCTNNSTTATVTCTLNSVGAGHALVIGIYSASVTSVTSSSGTPASVISNYVTYEGRGDFNVYLLSNTAAGNITITSNASSSGNENSIVVDEYSNVATSPLDGSATGSCTGYCTTVSTSNFTTTTASDMLWSMCNADQGYPTPGTVPITWTSILAQGGPGGAGYDDYSVEDGVAGAAGTYYGECTSAYLSSIATVALMTGSGTQVATPTFSPAAGTYTSAQAVTISDTTSGASIYYTTNGTTPTTASTHYTAAITVSATETLEALATHSGDTNSAVGSAAYTIVLPIAYTSNQCTSGGVSGNTDTCTLTVANTGDTVVITETTNNGYLSGTNTATCGTVTVIRSAVWDGTTAEEELLYIPNASAGSCTVTIGLDSGAPYWSTIQATDWSGTSTSAPIDNASCTSSPYCDATGTGTTATGSSASITTANANEMVIAHTAFYGSNTISAVSPFTLLDAATSNIGIGYDVEASTGSYYTSFNAASSAPWVIMQIALVPSSGSSPTVATPTFSPAAGTYTSAQTVTISDTTSGASIYYTTNGTTPTTASTHYTVAVTVSATETLKALATHSGDTNSAVGSAVYTINLTTATPTFSPGAGNYSTAQTVTISDTTSGSNIYYTTNGTTPTTASTHYTAAVTVSATETLQALATASSYANSAVASAAYTIGSSGAIYTVQHNSASAEGITSEAVAFPSNVTSGNVILVAESTYDAETLDTPTDTKGNSFTQLVTAGTSGDSVAAVYAATANSSGADTVTCNISASNNLHCHIYEVHGITTTVDKTGNSTVSSTAQTVSTSAATTNADDFIFAFFTDNDSGSNLTVGPGLGDAELSNNGGGDSGFSEDKVVIATGVQTATATSSTSDPDVNVIVALKTTGTPTVSTPTLSPAAGTYISAQTVTLGDWTAGETIYYTTNGTTPTTNSAVYSSPIVVSATENIEAMATSSGFANSAVASGVYTIAPLAATPTFSPAAGTYTTAQTVTISDTISGANIYYTTNGTTPTTASTHYTAAVTVSAASETLEAIATATGYTQSAVASGVYFVNPVATPAFSPVAGTYTATQTVSISDGTSGSTIYYTTNGTTPTTTSSIYSSAIAVSATETVKAIATHSGFTSLIGEAVYFIDSGTAGTCDGMSVGTSVAGTADMNGFVPFQNATGMTTLWNTNIASAAVDPNNAAIQTTAGYAGLGTHVNFGASPGDGGIPFMVVDSSSTPSVPIYVIDYSGYSDNVVAPYSTSVPIEGDAADCSGWPDTYQSDSHTNVLDRHTCWDYETYNTNRCNGLYDASTETIWDMQNGEMRPWGWTSTDAAGLSVMAGLLKYDEAASGTIKHAIRYTMAKNRNDANGGYFVEPASHAAEEGEDGSYGAPNVLGMRIRLNSTFNISGYSAINQAILTAMQQYGMINADNGGYFFLQGATDSRWNDSDLASLGGIPSTDFTVIQTTPTYPGYDSVTAPTGVAPTINSFTATTTSITSGSPVTFDFSVSGDSYDYIDMIGPVRLTSGSGNVTINPTATQTYTLYSVNQYGNNGVGPGYGVTLSTPITVVVSGSTVVAPTFTPVAGTYSAAQAVTFNTKTYPYATFYYTTDGTTPTTNSTKYVIPQPMGEGSGTVVDITVSATSTIKAIAVAPGYASPSAVSSAAYTIN